MANMVNPMEQMIADAVGEAVRHIVREEIEAAFQRHYHSDTVEFANLDNG